jgi:hypothetical protein
VSWVGCYTSKQRSCNLIKLQKDFKKGKRFKKRKKEGGCTSMVNRWHLIIITNEQKNWCVTPIFVFIVTAVYGWAYVVITSCKQFA